MTNHIGKTTINCFRFLNEYYQEYIRIENNSSYVKEKELLKVKMLLILDILEKSLHPKTHIITVSRKHNDVYFEHCFCNIVDFCNNYELKNADGIKKLSDSQTGKGVYTVHGYIMKIELQYFVDRWFLKIKY